MQFDPRNNIVKRCIQGMELEENGKPADAGRIFFQAWKEASNNFEKFLAAYYVARHQNNEQDKLYWLQSTMKYAMLVNDDSVKTAYPNLYLNIAECYEDLNDPENAAKFRELANSAKADPSDQGPFYHGTRAEMRVGELLIPGFNSNYEADLTMNHIYFTALVNGAGLAAALAKGDGPERVYIVEPTGQFENDPNVTDKKFPGNPSRSYRTSEPLRIVGEETEWVRQTPEQVQQWRDKLASMQADSKGKIIN